MLTDTDLKKIKKLLIPLATKRDIGSGKDLAALWEKYAKIMMTLDSHAREMKLLKDILRTKKDRDERSLTDILLAANEATEKERETR